MAQPAAKAKPAARRGRPSKFRDEFPEQARKLCLLGFSDEKIAAFFGVSLWELAYWAWWSEEFFVAITPADEDRRQWERKCARRRDLRSAAKRSRMATSKHERLANTIRARMWAALKGKTGGLSLRRLGYSVEALRAHLQARFLPGMSWQNYGRWHVDHIRPCASFDLTDPGEFAECSNLQPLWALDNIRKGATYAGA
jgi:hypothetical protein